MKWKIAASILLCVILTEEAVSNTIKKNVPITQTTVNANESLNERKLFASNSTNMGNQKKEHIYHVFLCEGNSEVEVVIPVSWTLRLSCGLKNLKNRTEVVWHYKDESNVTWDDSETKNTSTDKSTSEKWLELTNMSLSHSGNYSCSVNKKTCHRTILVKVDVCPVISEGKRHLQVLKNFTQKPLFAGSNATFYSNGNARLNCNASGHPLPTITWLINDEVVNEEVKVMGVSIQNNSLLLKDVSRLGGAYTCVASNRFGSDNATTFIQYFDPKAPDIHTDYKSLVLVDEKHNMSITVGSNATVYARSVLVLICNATGSPYPHIHWTKNGDDIFGGQVDDDRKLYLSHDPAQNGEYSCEARNFMGSAKRSSYIKFIEPMPPVIIPSKEEIFATNGENHVFVKVGDNLTTIAGTAINIHCPASGSPKPNIIWYYNGRVCQNFLPDSPSKESYFYQKAIFPNASGNYTCVAKNAFGTASATSSINAIEPVMPYINSSEKDVVSFDMAHPVGKTIGGSLKCLVGASIWLECPMGGFPPPEIKWKKDNLPIFSGKRIKVSRKRINVLGTIMSDTGWYSCSVSNGVGTVTLATFVHLIVPEKPRIKRFKNRLGYIVDNLPTPFSAQIGIDLRILAHRKVTVRCSATGFPKPVLLWQKNRRPFVEEDGVFVYESGHKLVFQYLEISQGGEYSCVASNAAGEDVSRTRIVGRMPLTPKVEITKAILSKYQPSPQKNVEVYEIPQTEPRLVRGSDVILQCVARRGYPRAVFRWFKDDKPIRGKTKDSFNRSKLKLRNMQRYDEGTYKCFASNIMGEHEKTIELRLERPRKL